MARRRSRPASTQQLVVKRLVPLIIAAIVAIVGYAQKDSSSTSKPSTSKPSTSKSSSRQESTGKTAQTPKPVPPQLNDTGDPTGESTSSNVDVNRSVGFKTKQRFDDHYIKHGREFGDISKQRYLEMAQELRDAPLSNDIIEARQVRGNLARFDKRSGAFLAYNDNLVIQTFFRPNDGEAYFRRAVKAKG